VRCRGGRGEGPGPGAYGKGEELGGSRSPRMESSPEGSGLHFALPSEKPRVLEVFPALYGEKWAY
jgi:hypothetical protein